jgi:hypothetical protein
LKSKKYYISLFILGLLIISCSRPYIYRCDYSLINPQLNIFESEELLYSDSLINIHFEVNSENAHIGFVLQNNIDKTIKIDWDKISYIGPTGVTERVIHTSAQLIEKNTLQTPTIIRPRKKINDDIAPVSLIYKRGDDWNTAPLFNGYKKEDLENKEMSIYFPLEIGGEKRNIHLRLKLVM